MTKTIKCVVNKTYPYYQRNINQGPAMSVRRDELKELQKTTAEIARFTPTKNSVKYPKTTPPKAELEKRYAFKTK